RPERSGAIGSDLRCHFGVAFDQRRDLASGLVPVDLLGVVVRPGNGGEEEGKTCLCLQPSHPILRCLTTEVGIEVGMHRNDDRISLGGALRWCLSTYGARGAARQIDDECKLTSLFGDL